MLSKVTLGPNGVGKSTLLKCINKILKPQKGTIFKEVVAKKNIAAIVTMHDLNLAARFASKFLLLKEGTVFTAGGFEVMTPENIEAVYAVPVAVERLRNVPVVVPL